MCPSSKDILLNRHGITIQIRTLTLIISLPSHQQTRLEFSSCLSTVSRNQGSATGTHVTVMYVSLGAFIGNHSSAFSLTFMTLTFLKITG